MLSAANKSKKKLLWPAAAAAPVAEDPQRNSDDMYDTAFQSPREILLSSTECFECSFLPQESDIGIELHECTDLGLGGKP